MAKEGSADPGDVPLKRLLIVTQHIERSHVSFPLAPIRLKAVLDQTGLYETEIREFTLTDPAEVMAEAILSSRFDAVGFSLYLWNSETLCKTAGHLKTKRPDLPLFAGGPEVTARTGELEKTGLFRFLIQGEGEAALPEQLHILFNGENTGGTFRKPVPDLSILPSPFLDETVALSAYEGVLWELSRGCPYSCAFCFEGRGEKGVRRFPQSLLQKELTRIRDAGISRVWVLDPTFNADKREALELLEMFAGTAPEIHYSLEIRAENVNEHLADAFAELDVSLQIGLQSIHDDVLRNINRSLKKEKYLRGIHRLQKHDIPFGLDLIAGLPGDTLAGFTESLDWALALNPEKIDLFPLSVLPGTELADKADNWQLVYDRKPPYRLHSSPSFPAEDLASAEDIIRRCDRFYNQGRAAAWLPMLLRETGLSPSEIIQSFPTEGEDILTDQLKTVRKTIYPSGIDSRPLEDLIVWLDAFRNLLDGLETSPVTLNYAPEELEELFTLSLEEFSRFYQKQPQVWHLAEEHGEIYWYLEN